MKQSDQIIKQFLCDLVYMVQLQGQMLIVVVELSGEYTYLGCSEIKTIVINLTLIVQWSSFKNSQHQHSHPLLRSSKRKVDVFCINNNRRL